VEADPSSAHADEAEEGGRRLAELLEQLGRDMSALMLREAEVGAARNRPAFRRTARDAITVGAAAVAFATAFLLVNWAVVRALSGLPEWLAPLVPAAVWAIVGGGLVWALRRRPRETTEWSWWQVFGRSDEIVEDRERARDDALHAVRETLDELATTFARDAKAYVGSSIEPLADEIVDVGEDLVAEVAEELLEEADESLDDVVEDLPGGSLVGQVVDFVLIPGRFGVRVMTTVLKGNAEPERTDATDEGERP
jgi:hypothetical protein